MKSTREQVNNLRENAAKMQADDPSRKTSMLRGLFNE